MMIKNDTFTKKFNNISIYVFQGHLNVQMKEKNVNALEVLNMDLVQNGQVKDILTRIQSVAPMKFSAIQDHLCGKNVDVLQQ